MTVQKPCVAFVIHDIIHYRASLSLARAVASEFTIHLYFIDDTLLDALRREIPETYTGDIILSSFLRKLNLYRSAASFSEAESRQKKSLSQRLVYALCQVTPMPLKHVKRYMLIQFLKYLFPLGLFRHWMRALLFQRLLARHRPDILVLNQADVEHMSEIYLGCAKKRGIKTIVNPFTFCTTESILKFFEVRMLRSRANWFDRNILQPVFPQWFHSLGDNILMRADPMMFVTARCLGYRYAEPWKQDYSSADVLLVDSAMALDHYRKMAFPEEQLRYVGLPEQDVLATRLRDKPSLYQTFCDEYDLDSAYPLALIALPPEYDFGIERSEFSSFHALISFVLSPFHNAGNWNVVICPHPRSPLHTYEVPHERVRIARKATIELVPLSNVYVSFVSVTIKWANLCGIPAINYDVYAMDDFAHLETENIINVKTKSEYEQAAMSLCADPEYYAKWRRIQQQNRHQWGNTDGTSQDKLTALLHELIPTAGMNA